MRDVRRVRRPIPMFRGAVSILALAVGITVAPPLISPASAVTCPSGWSSGTNSTCQKSFEAVGSASFAVPSGVTKIQAILIGGGGGGGYAAANSGAGGGGGGGALMTSQLTVAGGDTISVVVAAGGAAGTASSVNGGSGGDSTISTSGAQWSTQTVLGGGGGTGAGVGGAYAGTGYAGGAASSGTYGNPSAAYAGGGGGGGYSGVGSAVSENVGGRGGDGATYLTTTAGDWFANVAINAGSGGGGGIYSVYGAISRGTAGQSNGGYGASARDNTPNTTDASAGGNAYGGGGGGGANSTSAGVALPGGGGSGRVLVRISPPPTVNSLSPSLAAVGDSITITGDNFSGTPTVNFGVNASSSVTLVSASVLTVTVPSGTGAVDVEVINPDGQSGTKVNGFTYGTPPTVTGVNPASGTYYGGQSITISGTGFASGANVYFGNTSVSGVVTVVNSTTITTTTPYYGLAATVAVKVVNADGGQGVLPAAYTYVVPPSVTASLSPATGSTAGGTAVAITGTGFVDGATVSIGGSAATQVTFVSSTSLTAVTPLHVAGAVTVLVTNPNGATGSRANAFTYVAPPTVLTVTPASGPDTGGTSITITGTGFVSGATVTIGTTSAVPVVFGSSTTLTATTPAGAAGIVDVTVTNPNTLSGVLGGGFTYTGSNSGGGGGGGGAAAPEATPTPTSTPSPTTTPTANVNPLSPVELSTTAAPGVGSGGLQQGASLMLVGGQPVALKVSPDRGTDPTGLTLTSTGFRMWIAGRGDQSDPLGLTPKNALILQSEQGIATPAKKVDPIAEVTASGFKPGTDVELWILPTTYVGKLPVGVNGSFTGKVPIPRGLAIGGSTLQANGFTPHGVVRSVSLGIDLVGQQSVARNASVATFFAEGSSQLTTKAKRTLDQFARIVPKTATSVRVTVTGFVQPTTFTGNDYSLSDARAKTVSAYLKAKGLSGAYAVSGKGRATQQGAAARRVVSVVTYGS